MRLSGKLARWQQAGLLSAEQSAAILDYERRTHLGWQGGLAFLGVFAIVIGVLAVVASNWQAIPPWWKLGAHLALNALVALGVLRSWERPVIAQLCLLAWYGLTLSFIGLMGQVFHLAGSTAEALQLWTVLTSAAVVIFGNSALVLLPWVLGCLLTLVAMYLQYVLPWLKETMLPALLLFGVALPAAAANLAARLSQARWQALSQQLVGLPALLPLVTAALVCQFWYVDDLRNFTGNPAKLAATLVLAVLAVLLACQQRLAAPDWLGSREHYRLLLLGAGALIVLPFLLPWVESELLAALSFIGLCLLLGWIGHRTQSSRLISLATGAIALRIFVVYLEVFGSMLQTGFGLIFSGVLLLVLLNFARSLNRKVSFAPQRDSGTGGQP